MSDDFKIPSLGLPSFSGSYDTWLGFHDVFTSMVHNNVKTSPILKLRHLRDCLKGEAAELIASVQLSAENYLIAWEIVKETYDNRKLIRQNHIQDLFNIPYMSKEFSVRSLLNSIQKHVRALKVLDEPVESWGSLLIVLIRNKMNAMTLEKWDEFSCESECPTYEEIIAFLQRRAQLEDTKSAQSRIKPHNFAEKKRPFNSRPSTRSQMQPQHAFLATKSQNFCSYCKCEHDIFSCDSFLNLQIIDRFKFAKKKSLCLNCLQSTHRTSQCSGGPCKKCQKKHNSLLHFENQPHNETNDRAAPLSSITHTYFANNITSNMLLSTAIVDLISDQGKTRQCRLLLDNGSQSHYLTESVVSLLKLHRRSVDISVSSLGTMHTSVRHSVSARIKSRYKKYEQNLDFLVVKELNYLGWIVAGEVYGTSVSSQKTVQCNFACDSSMNVELSKFWELEEIPNTRILSPDEVACEELFAKTTLRNPDGRYLVRLPFNEKRDEIGDSRNLALRRLYSLESRFKR